MASGLEDNNGHECDWVENEKMKNIGRMSVGYATLWSVSDGLSVIVNVNRRDNVGMIGLQLQQTLGRHWLHWFLRNVSKSNQTW